MRFVLLTHAEAADNAVMANVAAHLMADGHIAFIDRPDVGKPAPLALPAPAVRSPAALAFGGAPSTAAVAALPTVPVTSTPPTPAAPPPAPPPVPVAPALSAPVPPAPPAAGDTPKVDSAGLPWDARIHASSKALNKGDGTWRQKRETDPALVLQVEAELRAVMGLPAKGAAPAPAAPPPPAPASVFGLAASMGLAPPPLPAAPANFSELMEWMAPFMPHKLTPENMLATLLTCGVPSLNALISRPDLVPVVHAALVPLTQ